MKNFNNDNIYFDFLSELISIPKTSTFGNSKTPLENFIDMQKRLENIPVKYIPLEYRRKEDFKDIVQNISSEGWSIPVGIIVNRLIDLKEIDYCSDEIDDAFTIFYTDNKNKRLRELIDIIISNEECNEWIQIIEECYESFDSDRFACIIPCLMAIIEGYLAKKIGTYNTQDVKLINPTETKVNAVDTENPNHALYYLGRYSVVLVIENLYQKSDFSGVIPISMNRHWIMHGRKIAFNPKVDALKLFNLIGSISMAFNVY